jgi:hypothetical protein
LRAGPAAAVCQTAPESPKSQSGPAGSDPHQELRLDLWLHSSSATSAGQSPPSTRDTPQQASSPLVSALVVSRREGQPEAATPPGRPRPRCGKDQGRAPALYPTAATQWCERVPPEARASSSSWPQPLDSERRSRHISSSRGISSVGRASASQGDHHPQQDVTGRNECRG